MSWRPNGSSTFAQGYTTIDYEHISPRRLYRPSRLTIEAVDVAATTGMRVGYIQGVGDNSAPALEQLGIDVTKIDPGDAGARPTCAGTRRLSLGRGRMRRSPRWSPTTRRLLDYARAGGTLVVQYGQYEMQQPGIMPYPVTINRPHDRVTDENATVTILDSTACGPARAEPDHGRRLQRLAPGPVAVHAADVRLHVHADPRDERSGRASRAAGRC